MHKLPHVTRRASSASPRSQRLAIAAPHGRRFHAWAAPRLPPGDRPSPSLPLQRLPQPRLCAPRFGPCAGPAGAVRGRDPGPPRRDEGFAAPALLGLYWLPERRPPGRQGYGEWGLFWGVYLPPAHFPHPLSARGREGS